MRKLVDSRIHGGGREAINERRDWWRFLGKLGSIPYHLTVSVRESSWRWQPCGKDHRHNIDENNAVMYFGYKGKREGVLIIS